MEARPSGGDSGCVSGELEPAEGVCFSPICNVGSLSGEGGPGSGHIGGDYAHMAHTALVPTFLSMAIASPILLPPQQDMLMSPQQERHPLGLNGTLSLAAWTIFADERQQQAFQRTLLPWLSEHGEAHRLLTIAHGQSGLAGVVNGRLIRLMPLWQM